MKLLKYSLIIALALPIFSHCGGGSGDETNQDSTQVNGPNGMDAQGGLPDMNFFDPENSAFDINERGDRLSYAVAYNMTKTDYRIGIRINSQQVKEWLIGMYGETPEAPYEQAQIEEVFKKVGDVATERVQMMNDTLQEAPEQFPVIELTDDEMDVFSYAWARMIGNRYGQIGIRLDPWAVEQGIADLYNGQGQLNEQELQQSIMEINQYYQMFVQKMQQQQQQQQQMQQQQQQQQQNPQLAQQNAAAAQQFLAQNKTQPGVQELPSGLQYKIVTEGTGASPTVQDKVKVHYEGKLLTGQTFDSSYERGEPASFPLGGVIPAWQQGIPLMKVGGKITLYCPPNLAYGPNGNQSIPPNSLLIFEVELLEINPAQ